MSGSELIESRGVVREKWKQARRDAGLGGGAGAEFELSL